MKKKTKEKKLAVTSAKTRAMAPKEQQKLNLQNEIKSLIYFTLNPLGNAEAFLF